MNSDEQKSTLDRWQSSAVYWDKYRDVIAQLFAPVTAGLVTDARIGPGHKVLDIGGGSGEPSLTMAEVVGPGGSITYTDPAVGMVQAAKAEAARRGVSNIEFRQCSADALPFPDESFDTVVGRFSAMFFSNPVAGMREVLRVVREKGLASFAVWGPEKSNPFFSTINDTVARFVKGPPDDPDAPDAFRFADRGKLATILKNAGAPNVVERQFDFHIAAKMSFEKFWQLRTEMSESLRTTMAGLTKSQISEIKESVSDAASKYFVDERMSFPAQVLIITAR